MGGQREHFRLPPRDYVPVMAKQVTPTELREMCHWHALPDGWEGMEYEDFLEQRRELIGKVIEEAYGKLRGAVDELRVS